MYLPLQIFRLFSCKMFYQLITYLMCKLLFSSLLYLILLLGANYLSKTLNQLVTATTFIACLHIHVSQILCKWWAAVENKYINNEKETNGVKLSLKQLYDTRLKITETLQQTWAKSPHKQQSLICYKLSRGKLPDRVYGNIKNIIALWQSEGSNEGRYSKTVKSFSFHGGLTRNTQNIIT